jgi:hypothetical protein
MKTLDKVKVWNHSLSGELIEEGIGTLRRKDLSFGKQTIQRLATSYDAKDANAKEGKFERWFVTFPDEPKRPVSRWVREEDLENYFAAANKHLAKLAKELNKIL